MSFLGALFGGSGSTQSSSNKSYDYLKGALGGAVGTGVNAFNKVSDSIGSFDDYKKNSGFDFGTMLGTKGITGNAAASGLLNSGSTAKGLTDYVGGRGQEAYGNYLDKLMGVANAGQGYANTIAGTGGVSAGKSSANGGILSTLFG